MGSLRPDDQIIPPTPLRRLPDWKYSEGKILCELESVFGVDLRRTLPSAKTTAR